ncbi:caspase-1-like [Prorops nasuta]|uniref:caspase-1-like n=1 Tax=Prorops nasuta TaxID=863751 RepID=UPI0034CF05DF
MASKGIRTRSEETNQSCEKEINMEVQGVSSSGKPSSDVDGWPFRKATQSDSTSSQEANERAVVSCNLDPHAVNYDMNHSRRGVAVIFNHSTFKKMNSRKGSTKDCADLKVVLDDLDFQVRIFEDRTVSEVSSILQSLANEDHTDADCLIVICMSHGESGVIHAYDSLYPVEMLWTCFSADHCPTLAGKPKLFFIQACRGTRLDSGVQLLSQTDGRGNSYSIPTFADILVAFSTYDGFYSWRNPDEGSWFIQALCEELKENGRKRDLLTLLTFVNRRVAVEYQSYTPQQESFHAKKQIPSIMSMLTRILHFPEKSSDATALRVMDQ